MGGRTRSDANDAVRIYGARHRLRRRRQTQSDQKRRGRDRLNRQVSRASRLETWRALAARGTRACEPAVAGGRPFDPTSALKMGGLGRHARYADEVRSAGRRLADGRTARAAARGQVAELWSMFPSLPASTWHSIIFRK